MPKHIPLPPELQHGPFLFQNVRDNPLGAGRLRGPDLARPFRGIRVPPGGSATVRPTFLDHCAAYAPLMSDGRCFSHSTAARLWEAPLPTEFGTNEQLHVSSVAPQPAPRMAGIVGHQSNRAASTGSLRHGFRTSDAVDTWLSLGALLSRAELVSAGDHFVLDPVVLDPLDIRPFTTIDALTKGLEGFHGRGATSLRWALPRVREGSESRCESLLRLLILEGDLPEPALNMPVTDHNGRTLGRGDMVYVQWRTVVEYDGDQHRTNKRQYERDIHRLESFRNASWNVVQVRDRGLFVRCEETLGRIATALRRGGWAG